MTVDPRIERPVRVVFMGSPAFAVPTLEGLVDAGYEVVLAVSQPDRPAGRGRQIRRPAVAEAADARGIPVYQTATLRSSESRAPVEAANPDLIVVAAFGLLLPKSVLELPARGCLNVHASLLPRHRGAAPIHSAIVSGDQETGVTIMLMDEGMDTGPMLARHSTRIGALETVSELESRLAVIGRDLLISTIPNWLAGRVQACPQDESLATYAPKVKREDGRIDWTQPAEVIARRVRAYRGWPNAFTEWNGRSLAVLDAVSANDNALSGKPGTVTLAGDRGRSPSVVTGDGHLQLRTVQLEGRRPVSGEEFVNGYPAIVGSELGGT